MIRVNEIPNSTAAKAYYQAKNADYYLEGHEQPAYWHGKVAEMLGLSGHVSIEDFHALCDNLHPRTGETLTAARGTRRVGYDFTFSVPKSVSVAYALGQDDRLDEAFRGAVADTMAEVEREMATRVRKGKQDFDRHTGNMLWCDFLHTTSRPIKGEPDPQLHIHAVAFNLTRDREEGEWKAGQFGPLKANAPYFQAVFRARLATRLQNLGYDVQRKRDDFEIVGIPERVNKAFSRRTDLIEKLVPEVEKQLKKKYGDQAFLGPEGKAKLGATSREKKSKGLTWNDLLVLWNKRLKSGEQSAINATVMDATLPITREDRSREAVGFALDHLLERQSVVDQRSVMTEALKFGLGSVTPESVAEEIARRRDLIRRQVDGKTLVSTKGVLSEEKRLVAFAVEGRGRWKPLVNRLDSPPSYLAPGYGRSSSDALRSHALLNRRGPAAIAKPDLATLSTSQQAAVRHVWCSRDKLVLIRGAAGTGKTTLTRAALAGIDVPWVILAPTAEASRGVLRRDGFANAETLSAFLKGKDMQQRVKNGLIWLDEASLAGAHDMTRLIELADQLGARIVLSGDRRQHKSVARGDVLALLEDKAGLPVAEVSEIKRQTGEYKAAVKLASQGNVAGAVRKLDELGWVKEGTAELVDEYVASVDAGKSVLVVSPTHAEGDKVTAAIRERLKQEGRLGGQEQGVTALANANLTEAEKADAETLRSHAGETAQFHRQGTLARAGERVTITADNAAELAKQASRFVVYRPREIELAKGDTVRITANAKDLSGKHKLNNGAIYQVGGFTSAGNIRLDNGWILPAGFGHLQHGYTSTSHAAQGRTVDRVLIHAPTATFGAVDKATGYVAMSRAREKATIFTDDRDALLDAVSRERPRMLASELVRRPRHGVRSKQKRFVTFLRELGNDLRHRIHDVVREREVTRGR